MVRFFLGNYGIYVGVWLRRKGGSGCLRNKGYFRSSVGRNCRILTENPAGYIFFAEFVNYFENLNPKVIAIIKQLRNVLVFFFW